MPRRRLKNLAARRRRGLEIARRLGFTAANQRVPNDQQTPYYPPLAHDEQQVAPNLPLVHNDIQEYQVEPLNASSSEDTDDGPHDDSVYGSDQMEEGSSDGLSDGSSDSDDEHPGDSSDRSSNEDSNGDSDEPGDPGEPDNPGGPDDPGDPGDPGDPDDADDPGDPDDPPDLDDGDASSEDDQPHDIINEPISSFNDRRLDQNLRFEVRASVRCAVALSIAQAVRHDWSYIGIEDNLNACNALMSSDVIKTSKYYLWKYLGRDYKFLTFHVYCHNCLSYIAVRNDEQNEYLCQVCGEVQLRGKATTFITLSLSRQLSRLLQMPKVQEMLLNYRQGRNIPEGGGMSDLLDGAAYLRLREEGGVLSNDFNYSYSINSDGFRISNSSKLEAWPVYLTINELPERARFKYMILAGVLVSKKHPCMNTFLMPIVQEANLLSTNGVLWTPNNGNEIRSKFFPTVLTVDSVARYNMLCMNSFAGQYACAICLVNGVQQDEFGNVFNHRKYPIEEHPSPLRTHDQILACMMEAARTGEAVLGFKGLSVLLSRLLNFKCPDFIVGDRLHIFCLGVAKKHIQFMMKGENRNRPFYIGPGVKAQLDARIVALKTPSSIERPPRSIYEMNSWTGAEWRSFILYYCVPALQGLIQNCYVNHLSQLSHALFLLSSETVTPEDCDLAEELVQSYRQSCQNFFGLEYMVFNVHMLSHMPHFVRNWGPLRCHDTIGYETLNGELKKMVKSPTDAAEQIAVRYLMINFLRDLTRRENVPVRVREYISSSIFNEKPRNFIYSVGGAHFKGVHEVRQPNHEEILALQQNGFLCERMMVFKKIFLASYFLCASNENHMKLDNSFFYHTEGDIGMFCNAVYFTDTNGQERAGIFAQVFQQVGHLFAASHIAECEATNNLTFVTWNNVQSPAVRMHFGGSHFFSPLTNTIENH